MNDSYQKPRATRSPRVLLFLAICALGVSAFFTQVTLMRELLTVFAGNEMVFGVVLGNWLLLTGAGAGLGRTASRLRDPVAVLIGVQVLIAVAPIADVYLLRTLRNAVFLRGAAVGVTETVVSCLVILAPYCLVAGYALPLASRLLATEKHSASIGQVYFLDILGDIAGGLVFSFVLVWWLNHFQVLAVAALLNLALAGLLALTMRRWFGLGAVVAVSAGLIGVLASCDLDRLSAGIQYAGQRIVYQGSSPYGSLVVTGASGQVNFIENGVVLFSTHNVEEVETTVHLASAQRPRSKRVLLIGGGISGTAKEILKYPVEAVDYVELDPHLIGVARHHLPASLDDPRIHVHATDGRLFVRQARERYDVAIVDVPDPSTSQLNRFYTAEFFREIRRCLAPEGVVAISLGRYENFLGEELAALIAVAHQTLRSQFRNVLILPPGPVYLLASDGPLSAAIGERLDDAGIRTRLPRSYWNAALSPDRLADVRRAVSAESAVNRDFSPVLYYHHLRYWIRQLEGNMRWLGVAVVAILAVALVRFRPVSFAIFTTGLVASGLEVVLLIGFQVLFGSLYYQVGLIVTMFMIGLGLGSWTMNRTLERRGRRHLVLLHVAAAVYACLIPMVLIGLGRIADNWVVMAAGEMVILLLTLGLGALVGLEFPLAAKIDFDSVTSTAARLYTADYLGAAIGALVVSTLLIPIFGMIAVCLLGAALSLASGLILLWR